MPIDKLCWLCLVLTLFFRTEILWSTMQTGNLGPVLPSFPELGPELPCSLSSTGGGCYDMSSSRFHFDHDLQTNRSGEIMGMTFNATDISYRMGPQLKPQEPISDKRLGENWSVTQSSALSWRKTLLLRHKLSKMKIHLGLCLIKPHQWIYPSSIL